MKVQKMNLVYIHKSKIRTNDFNVNQLNVREYESLINSIKTLGFLQPIIVRKKKQTVEIEKKNPSDKISAFPEKYKKKYEYEIVDGQHRFMATKEISKISEIPCIVLEDISDEKAKAIVFAFTHSRGEFNMEKSYQILKDFDDQQMARFSKDSAVPIKFLGFLNGEPIIYNNPNEVSEYNDELDNMTLTSIYLPLLKDKEFKDLILKIIPTSASSRTQLSLLRTLYGSLLRASLDQILKGTEIGEILLKKCNMRSFKSKEKINRSIKRLEKSLRKRKLKVEEEKKTIERLKEIKEKIQTYSIPYREKQIRYSKIRLKKEEIKEKIESMEKGDKILKNRIKRLQNISEEFE